MFTVQHFPTWWGNHQPEPEARWWSKGEQFHFVWMGRKRETKRRETNSNASWMDLSCAFDSSSSSSLSVTNFSVARSESMRGSDRFDKTIILWVMPEGGIFSHGKESGSGWICWLIGIVYGLAIRGQFLEVEWLIILKITVVSSTWKDRTFLVCENDEF